jgi:hypothetical protein
LDPSLQRPVIFGDGATGQELIGGTWTEDARLKQLPFLAATSIVGPKQQLYSIRGRTVTLPDSTTGEVNWNGPLPIAFDPVREVLIRWEQGSLQMLPWSELFSATPQWQPMGAELTNTIQNFYNSALVWNPRQKAMMLVDTAGTYKMSATDADWSKIADGVPALSGGQNSIFFDRTCECLTDGNLRLKDGETAWQGVSNLFDTFARCESWTAARGALCWLERGSGAQRQTSMFLVRGNSATPMPAVAADVVDFKDDPQVGLFNQMSHDGMIGITRYQFESAATLSCAADATDTDGDELVGCQDPDCWRQCTPSCPAGVSCP